ncbi:glycosyltransferase family 39 protein [Rhizobium sp. C1]|uniref:glycosyltransferase family 39 protein n=1 Tax=Rhizobium sp. C1 TaxID=1349799 RepID=UPI001E59B067|nr:glycosyltransferase family 39 protein [Rhizobium sp. C1]MCD2177311.1 glycosyltransferase family 39 protein [Rhizobium sp. C1]
MWNGKSEHNTGAYRNFDIIVLICIPVAYALINDNWMFTAIGWLDPWYYIGYGLNYNDPAYLDDYYKISRLPWVLLEYVVRSNLSSYYSSVVMQMTLMCGTIAALYAVMLRTLGRVGAFFGVLFYATYVFSYASGGADYHNSCGGLFFALSWICAIRAAETNASARWTIATGAMIALSVHSIIVMVNLVPIPVVFFFAHFRMRHHRWPPIVKTVLWGTLGGLVVTAILCAINWGVGRNPWFFLLQFKLASSFVSDASHQVSWWHDWSTPWYLSRDRLYLLPAAAGLVTSIPLAFYIWWSKTSVQRRTIALLYVLTYTFYGVLWISWQTIGQTALDWVYFAYPLIFPLTGLIGAAAAVSSEKLETRLGMSFTVLGAVCAAVVLAPFALYPLFDFHYKDAYLFIAIGISFLIFIIVIARENVSWKSFVGSAIVFSLFMSVMNYAASQNNPDQFNRNNCQYNANNVAAIVEGHRFLRALGYPFKNVLIWADPKEEFQLPHCDGGPAVVSLGQFWPSLVSTGFRYVAAPWDAKKLDDIPDKKFQEIAGSKTLIVQVSNSPAEVEKLRNRFAALPDAPEIGQIQSHQLEQLPVKLYFFEVGPKG